MSDWRICLILTCGFPELVALCTVICRKENQHSCKDTKMVTQGHVMARKLIPLLRHVIRCDKNRPCELAFALDLTLIFFHSVDVGFAVLSFHSWILVILNPFMIALIKI